MSSAGIQSNRGDGYQTLVAFDWALTVLSDPDYQWIEVDSVEWSVDDVVIGKVDGTKICCQCKKNQTAFKAWSISDLTDELIKIFSLLRKDRTALVRLYSRSNFGDLSALREYSTSHADESSYQANLGIAHKETDTKLASLLIDHFPELSTYDFLQRISFVVSDDFERMKTLLRERLRQLASNPSAAYSALWERLDCLGMRIAGDGHSVIPQHRVTKDGLKELLVKAGAMLIPSMDVEEVRSSFRGTSSIGRTWRRDVGDQRIPMPLVKELLAAIEVKHRSILLTGLPGAGKTCVMLALQEELERIAKTRSDLVPLFIQSREFADFITTQNRAAQGLSAEWVERVARLADDAQVVVIIDSLDVLSIAREHIVLKYFLAQIDRLLLIPNVTVITACRDFDRHYDRRIAQRTWDKEFKCKSLSWDTEIAPLLTQFGIDASAVDTATRELICIPRELALYVELAQNGGSFNVVTSQALAQRYLAVTVQADNMLGNPAMQAIESIATEMLHLRRLAVHHQRFSSSDEVLKTLLSNNVLHKTQDGQLTFGHQTLLDVLVISGAMRRGDTLSVFIQGLSPVPFVRPSIRSFVAQLASGDCREFRKQLHAVLTGNHAFHIRRLVAESLAEQIPQHDDWLLIRELRSKHRDVFQVIYNHAVRIEWHKFWFKYLVPALKGVRDADGLVTHVYRTSQWKNDDPNGVIEFWAEALALDWIEKEQIAQQLESYLSDFQAADSASVAPLLLALLDLPRQEHGLLGQALARCVNSGGIEDTALWRYVTSQITDEDVLAYRFGNKLHCKPLEFGNSDNSFLADRMRQSTTLLNLAVADVERWSRIRASRYGETHVSYLSGFLRETSYADTHDQTDHRHVDSERILLDAIQSGILHHANTQSDWWKINRHRLCFSTEGALRYFAILACTSAPAQNLDVIGQMLCDKSLLESALSYEVGTLMEATFLQLDTNTQDVVQATVLAVGQKTTTDPIPHEWILQEQAQLLIAIPSHLRSPAAQDVIDGCEKIRWPLIRQPSIGMRGGAVAAPFSFEVFLDSSDAVVLKLLAHYNGYSRESFDDLLVGGEREVGSQLVAAASRHPTRFMNLLSANWEQITDRFRDDIIDGVATYLAHRYGNLQTSSIWVPKEDPDPVALALQILDELERNASHWRHNRAASKAIEGCSYVIEQKQDAARLTSLAIDFFTLEEQSSISGESVDLLTAGINMARGNAAESLMILANGLEKKGVTWPDSLPSALRLFAADKDPAIRALLLRRMPYLQSHHPDLGWELFELAMLDRAEGLWTVAEPCLYYGYHLRYDIVYPWLAQLYREKNSKDLETWGRICALAALSKQLVLSDLLTDLKALDSADAWRGAASVWTHPENAQQHGEHCFAGLGTALNAENQYASVIASNFRNLFHGTIPLVLIPIELLQRYFTLLETETGSARREIFGFDAWLNATSVLDPMNALEATEIYLKFVRRTKPYMYDHEHHLTQLLTRLFAQAEEQEESDNASMLQRVVMVQDTLLALGVNGVSDWLKAAERP